MGWVGPMARKVGRTGAKYGAKYGPHAVVLWNVAGDQVQAAAREKAAEIAERRNAFAEAEATAHGSVLKVVHRGVRTFVVFSGDEPVAAYPATERPFEELVAHADLGRRVTPEQHRERQLRARARRAGRRMRRGR
ncbi:MAG: hypothetical protein ACXVW2_08035 [Nocardioidaceae bacterium]